MPIDGQYQLQTRFVKTITCVTLPVITSYSIHYTKLYDTEQVSTSQSDVNHMHRRLELLNGICSNTSGYDDISRKRKDFLWITTKDMGIAYLYGFKIISLDHMIKGLLQLLVGYDNQNLNQSFTSQAV